jgi:hypothetical protein
MHHNEDMRNRRFMLVVSFFAALNVGLFLTPQGQAILNTTVSPLFGKSMMRADVTEINGSEFRFARGIVVSNVAGLLTVREADTKIEAITVNSSTKVSGTTKPVTGIKPGWHVLVTWPVGGSADSVVVEKKSA